MMELHIFNRAGSRLRAFAIGDAAEVIIGRDETCDIRIFSQIVSREHASIEREGEDLVLRDLQSTGGTFVRGDRIDQIRLEDGMEISIGPAVLKFFEAEI